MSDVSKDVSVKICEGGIEACVVSGLVKHDDVIAPVEEAPWFTDQTTRQRLPVLEEALAMLQSYVDCLRAWEGASGGGWRGR